MEVSEEVLGKFLLIQFFFPGLITILNYAPCLKITCTHKYHNIFKLLCTHPCGHLHTVFNAHQCLIDLVNNCKGAGGITTKINDHASWIDGWMNGWMRKEKVMSYSKHLKRIIGCPSHKINERESPIEPPQTSLYTCTSIVHIILRIAKLIKVAFTIYQYEAKDA